MEETVTVKVLPRQLPEQLETSVTSVEVLALECCSKHGGSESRRRHVRRLHCSGSLVLKDRSASRCQICREALGRRAVGSRRVWKSR